MLPDEVLSVLLVAVASGGQLQRIGICLALINQPTILLGDEPTGAFDSTSILLVTHDPKIAARATRVPSMLDGRIVGDRDQGPFDGDGLEQRRGDLSAWLLEQERGRERSTSRSTEVPA